MKPSIDLIKFKGDTVSVKKTIPSIIGLDNALLQLKRILKDNKKLVIFVRKLHFEKKEK